MSRFGTGNTSLGLRRTVWALTAFVGILGVCAVGVVHGSSSPVAASPAADATDLAAGGGFAVPYPRFGIVILGKPAFPKGTVGKAYVGRVAAVGGRAPIHWTLASGTLPPGLKLGSNTGAITGKPTKKGRSVFVVKATDSATPPQTAKLAASITIK